MADSTITLRVVGDTAKAGGSAASAPQGSGNAPAAAPQAPIAPGAPRGTYMDSPTPNQGTPANGGKTISGQLGAFALGWGGQQVFGSLAGALGTVPGMQREANWVGNIGGGALGGASAGATAGAAIGSIVPGAGTALGAGVGAAIGGVIGAATGAITAWTESLKASRETIEGIGDVRNNLALSTGIGRQEEAFRKTLEPMTREQRLGAIDARIQELTEGKGDFSLNNLESWLKEQADNGDTDTIEYRRKYTAYVAQMGRLSQLQTLRDQVEATPPIMPLAPGEVTDALAKRGGTVGPSVDVGDVNKDILAVLKDIYRLFDARANERTDYQSAIGRVSGAFGNFYLQ